VYPQEDHHDQGQGHRSGETDQEGEVALVGELGGWTGGQFG
jgi:hypothetical protein